MLARFAIARAMCVVSLSLPLMIRARPADFTLVLAAVLRQFEPMFLPEGVDRAQLDDAARRVTRALPRQRHPEIAPHALEVIGTNAASGDVLAAGAIELANRIAVLASGNIVGGVQSLRPQGGDLREALSTATPLGRLVRVAVSDRFLEARHLSGADRL
jgi:hypothetical protein